ncbi:MAG TPA: hypothetical protein VE640_00820 [Candidatus Bathyarchaeia archaeon]|nr:hypothetical protein [Candidatus Bathyarchaeia archaeon]
MAPKSDADDTSLKRLGGGRWQTRDVRFTVEPESGTWVVVDAEQTDDLGLPLVRGPFRSLGDAKEAITAARTSPPAASPLAGRVGRHKAASPVDAKPGQAKPGTPSAAPTRAARGGGAAAAPPEGEPESSARPSAEPAEPRWFGALEPDARRQARRMIARLEEAGAPDPEGMARRDIVGEVAAVAAFVIERKLEALGPDADPAAVAALLAEGRDDDLGVRWRLVDGDGRPIAIDPRKGKARKPR